MSEVDQYIEEVVKRGDEGSELLAAKCAPTLRNSEYVDIVREGMNGLAVLRVPEDYDVVVHSSVGDPKILDPAEHAASLVDRLYEDAKRINAIPLGFANVIDASTGKKDVIEKIADALVSKSIDYRIAIMNGELAILGSRINCDANVSGTMLSIIHRNNDSDEIYTILGIGEVPAAAFNPKGKAVYINSDGVGTKTEFYERASKNGYKYHLALWDSLAMKLDDTAKSGAIPMVVHDIVERNGNIYGWDLDHYAFRISQDLGYFGYWLYHEDVEERLKGWDENEFAFNVSGSAVSVIDEERLKNPLVPEAGDYLIAIRGKPNPRSNGITDKRRIMVEKFGKRWHETEEGKRFLEFLASPSILLFPVFYPLIESDSVTSVYHMSGGAFNGKLAKPLAKQGLYVRLDDIFPPDPREIALAEFSNMPLEVAYAKWPMGNDGFVTTKYPDKALAKIASVGYGVEARVVGLVGKPADGRTGIELVGIKASDGKNVYFSGR